MVFERGSCELSTLERDAYMLCVLVRKGEVMFIEMVGDCNTSFVGLLLRDALKLGRRISSRDRVR